MLCALFTSLLLLLSQIVEARIATTTNVCPILGPPFPRPSNLALSPIFQNAANILDQQITAALRTGLSEGGTGQVNQTSRDQYNQTTFSIGMFNVHDDGLVWQRHYTDPSVAQSPVGVSSVDADTVYRIGSISKLMTTYIFLILEGDRRFNDPVTEYIPELMRAAHSESVDPSLGVLPRWDEITIEDLATHTAGLYDDYGLDDIELYRNKGLPPLPKSRYPKCAYQIGLRYYPCTPEEFVKGLATLPALFAVADTPSYSNAGFDLFGIIIEKIIGYSLERAFNETLVEALNLTGAYYTVPHNKTDIGAIPVSAYHSGWNQELATANPDGGNFMSTNSFATVGKAIMNSTQLPRAVTRRWIKPRTFTGDPRTPLGAPWEIYQWQTPLRTYYLYTKEGEEGNYAALIVLIPDLGLGYTVMTVGETSHAGVAETLSSIVAGAILPAVEKVATLQAHYNFAGRYVISKAFGINSSLVITTDDQPGMRVTEWISNGTNLLPELFGSDKRGHYVDFRLWPNELYEGNLAGFTASSQGLPRVISTKPLPEGCQTWLDTGGTQYGNVALGSFIFNLDPDSGVAKSVRLPALSITLYKTESSS